MSSATFPFISTLLAKMEIIFIGITTIRTTNRGRYSFASEGHGYKKTKKRESHNYGFYYTDGIYSSTRNTCMQ